MSSILRKALLQAYGQVPKMVQASASRSISRHVAENQTPDELICRYECIFNNPETDGWDVRQAMNDLNAFDAVPDPRIIIAALKACRRLNDYGLSIRFLEMVRSKCGIKLKEIWPYIKQETCKTVGELGCDFPEDLGYDRPELAMISVYDLAGYWKWYDEEMKKKSGAECKKK